MNANDLKEHCQHCNSEWTYFELIHQQCDNCGYQRNEHTANENGNNNNTDGWLEYSNDYIKIFE